jgi:hypothetical protein
MTTHRYKRCIHCGIVYAYQTSGGGCGRPENSSRWCPECAAIAKEAIREALKDVPVKRKRVLVETDEVHHEELLNHRQQRMAEVKKEGKVWCERVAMNLYDIKDPERTNHAFYIPYKDKLYHLSYWHKGATITDVVIKVEMELNTETGEMRPWDPNFVKNADNPFDWFGSY